MKPEFIDVHAHLNMLKAPIVEALALAKLEGVTRVITIGTEPTDHPIVLEIAQRHYPQVVCTLGVHPHEAELWSEDVGEWIRSKVNSSDSLVSRVIVAIGEIGLDYFRNQTAKNIQIAAFRQQMELAQELDLPVEIHTRDADQDTAEILSEFKGKVSGLLHCFTSSMALASNALDCGFDVSFSGVVTFKNAAPLREVVKFVPLDRLHVETDAPFLAPVPNRGQSNLPQYVVHTAAAVAALKEVSLERLSEQTLANAERLFF